MYYSKFPRSPVRSVTPQRLRMAKAALDRQRAKLPLFAGQVAEEQPTPEERIAQIDAGFLSFWQEQRDIHAKNWHDARRMLRELPEYFRAAITAKWQRGYLPGNAAYLLDMIRTDLREAWGIEKADRFVDEIKAQSRSEVLPC